MAGQSKASKVIGLIVGVAAVGGAVYSVFFVEWNTQVPPPPPVVRPLKTMVIESPFAASARKYPGEVRANEEVDLAFQVAGQLIDFPVKKGQDVDEGELLGRLDPRDFENAHSARQAALSRARSEHERISKLAESDVATQKEIYESKSAYDAAAAEERIARKALEDTRLLAPFAGVVADTFIDSFENVNARQPIVSLQQIDHVEIVVNVPEERVVRAERNGEQSRFRFVATFEYLPGREFDVEVKEFSTEADPATQTYAATFVMPAPKDALILPGMTATIRECQKEPEATDAVAFAIPVDAVPLDGLGNYFVWAVKDTGEGTGTVHRVDVQVGEMVGDDILVLAGVKPSDRIALAGVHLLEEGQQVRPFSAKGDATP
ncbi:MAG: efflux RND transporter periplasmic adaptor subunit [bacterium]|nr:efflux RND transporter periplasmic adaptor subunit [bacterium]